MMDCGDGRMLREAIAVHEQAVECRMPADPEQPAEPKPDL